MYVNYKSAICLASRCYNVGNSRRQSFSDVFLLILQPLKVCWPQGNCIALLPCISWLSVTCDMPLTAEDSPCAPCHRIKTTTIWRGGRVATHGSICTRRFTQIDASRGVLVWACKRCAARISSEITAALAQPTEVCGAETVRLVWS